jgi:hypothetical protein
LYDFETDGERELLLVIDGVDETLGDTAAVGVGLLINTTRITEPSPVLVSSVTN